MSTLLSTREELEFPYTKKGAGDYVWVGDIVNMSKANTMHPDQTAPLVWVHIVCNIGYPRT